MQNTRKTAHARGTQSGRRLWSLLRRRPLDVHPSALHAYPLCRCLLRALILGAAICRDRLAVTLDGFRKVWRGGCAYFPFPSSTNLFHSFSFLVICFRRWGCGVCALPRLLRVAFCFFFAFGTNKNRSRSVGLSRRCC